MDAAVAAARAIMIGADAVIVGGGPAGSTCARLLRQAGWDVLVVDRARFPRDKVCAGWVTPPVFSSLELSPDQYRDAGLVLQEVEAFETSVMGEHAIETRYGVPVSYAIRRCEFDDFLLRRSGARVIEDEAVETIRRDGADWVINERIRTPMLIGAGGHFCPVARYLRGGADSVPAIVAKEAEFVVGDGPVEGPKLYFCRDLDGYAWCIRKGPYLNVGIGRRDHAGFADYVREFQSFLEAQGIRASAPDIKWRGHAYLAAGFGARPAVGSGVMTIGDAAGVAYPESGEGIRPSIESAILAARTLIAGGGHFASTDLQPYAQAMRRGHPPVAAPSTVMQRVNRAVGRRLMRSRVFTRRVVLDRWFLRRASAVAA